MDLFLKRSHSTCDEGEVIKHHRQTGKQENKVEDIKYDYNFQKQTQVIPCNKQQIQSGGAQKPNYR